MPNGVIGAVALSFSRAVAEGSTGVCASAAVTPSRPTSHGTEHGHGERSRTALHRAAS